jgi:HAD superfamily hydrolase (TIGR01549 family)
MKRLPVELSRKPDAVLFDLDNTLYAYDPAHEAAMAAVEARTRTNLGIDTSTFRDTFEDAKREVKARLGKAAASHSRLLYFQRLIEMTTGKSDPSLSLELEKTYWRRFMSGASLFPGARDLLGELRYAGIPLLLVTDLTAQIQLRKLVFFELEQAFDHIVTSEESGADKPDPAPFRLALKKAGLSKEGLFWMVGDSAEKDILGAKEAVGALGIQKVHGGVQRSEHAVYHVADFTSLAAGVRHAFGGTSH